MGGEHHREEQACEGYRVPRAQDEDREWAYEGGPVQEQARKDREPQAELLREEAVLEDPWAVELRGHEGAEGLELGGFVAINGKTAQGRALYAKAKSFYSK